jgi:hypothetical protein
MSYEINRADLQNLCFGQECRWRTTHQQPTTGSLMRQWALQARTIFTLTALRAIGGARGP